MFLIFTIIIIIQSPRFLHKTSINYESVYIDVRSKHSNFLLTILLLIDCSKMARIRIHTSRRIKEKPYKIKGVEIFFFQILKYFSMEIRLLNLCLLKIHTLIHALVFCLWVYTAPRILTLIKNAIKLSMWPTLVTDGLWLKYRVWSIFVQKPRAVFFITLKRKLNIRGLIDWYVDSWRKEARTWRNTFVKPVG